MSVEAHVTELKRKHAAISEEVERLEHSPSASTVEVQELKREKLKLKDEISQLSQ